VIEFVRALPKVELHLHLEGAAPFETMAAIYRRNGCEELSTPESVAEFVRHHDFVSFLDRFRHFLTWLKTPEDYVQLAESVARRLAADGVVYAEWTVSLGAAMFFHGIEPLTVLDSIRRGIEQADVDIEIGILVDLIRNLGPEAGWNAVRFAAAHQDKGIVGINLGGDEAKFPAGPYADLYAFARDAGLGLTAHAGEAAGASSVWETIDLLGVTRIGHGTRATEDLALLPELSARGVLIEVCASSNVSTGVIPSLSAHPLRDLMNAGCRVCLNTDDPTYFGSGLSEEVIALAERFSLTKEEIVAMQLAAIEGSFAPATTRARVEKLLI